MLFFGLALTAGGVAWLAPNRDEPVVAASSTEPSELAMNREDWEFAYSQANLGQIRDEIESLRRYMYEETHDYYEAQFQMGNYELVPRSNPDGTYPVDVGDDLAEWRYLPAIGLAKMTLPLEGFERAYEAKSRTSWLIEREGEVREFEALMNAEK
jgi:hypothetical protein